MKEILKLKNLILVTLILVLVVPVLNTAHLYGHYSDLSGLQKNIATYFIGITFEIAVFLCVKAGYRPAGIFFAIVSLLIGLLYHVPFSDIRSFDQYYTHSFISKVVIQVSISTLGYFLSELYVLILKREQNELQANRTEGDIILLNIEKGILADELKLLSNDLQEARTLISKRDKLEQEIISLQKQKAGMSRTLTKEN